MSVELAIALILAFIMVYISLVNVYSILFRLTGLTRVKARFQTISLLTNSGYTTSESEIITTNNARRKIAVASMLTGYIFSVVIVSLVLNLINAVSARSSSIRYMYIFIAFGVFIFLILLFKIPFIKRPFEKMIEAFGRRLMKKHQSENIITLLDSYGRDAIAQVTLNVVPENMKDKQLSEINIRDEYNLNILMIKSGGITQEIKRNTVLRERDIVIVFGPLQSIKKLFMAGDIKKPKEEE